MTVKQTLRALAGGQITLAQACDRVAAEVKPAKEPSRFSSGSRFHFGVDDLPYPGDNDPQQINLVPGLGSQQRASLWRAVASKSTKA